MENSALAKLNLNQLRIFEAVYRLQSMTLAAQELFLTQSGVSQHIKSLEENLGVPLFVRSGGELHPAPEALILYQVCQRSFTEIDGTMKRLKHRAENRVEGTIKLGVPTEFGNNLVIPLLSPWSQQNPEVKFEIVYGYGTEMQEGVDNGRLDLAFIDSFKGNARIAAQSIYSESLNLVASTEYLKQKNLGFRGGKEKLPQLTQLEFLEYQRNEPVLRMWFRYHYGKKNVSLNIRAWAMSVHGVANFVKAGMGAAVLPDHVIERIRNEGSSIHIFKGHKVAMQNEISLAWPKKKPLSVAANEFKKYALKSFLK
jgi:DNA-binding transcriptional LysR family regulator